MGGSEWLRTPTPGVRWNVLIPWGIGVEFTERFDVAGVREEEERRGREGRRYGKGKRAEAGVWGSDVEGKRAQAEMWEIFAEGKSAAAEPGATGRRAATMGNGSRGGGVLSSRIGGDYGTGSTCSGRGSCGAVLAQGRVAAKSLKLGVSGDGVKDAADTNVPLAFAGLRDVVGGLHAHEGVHFHAEGFFEAQGHVAGEAGFGVEQTGEGWAGDSEGAGGGSDGEPGGLNEFVANEGSGMRGVFDGHDGGSFLLVVIL